MKVKATARSHGLEPSEFFLPRFVCGGDLFPVAIWGSQSLMETNSANFESGARHESGHIVIAALEGLRLKPEGSAGVLHVQPPMDVMSRMLAIRLHLDETGPENGPLRVILLETRWSCYLGA